MDLMWWGVVIAGMALLAGCIGAAMLSPDRAGRRELRPLAHVDRLTRLPEYVQALRRRMLSVIVVIFLLAVGFTAALWTTARPAGLPNIASASVAGQPEDIMVCVGESAATPAVAQILEYFAERVGGFGTTRVGLTSANVRVVPLTRDHQHAAARFTAYAHSADPGAAPAAFVAPVRYADYAATVEDVLALCLTGFPEFDEPAGQRRSLVYVGPGTLGENRGTPSLFSAEQVRELATTAGIQVNVVYTGPPSAELDALARDTGGQTAAAGSEVATQLAAIRNQPPDPAAVDDVGATVGVETPDVPLLMALLAVLALAWWPVVRRS